MKPSKRSPLRILRVLFSVMAPLVFVAGCSPPAKQVVGPARDYLDATEMFERGNFNRAAEFTEGLATASPPNDYTERARVLRVILFCGQVNGYKELAEAYGKGIENTKRADVKAADERLRSDYLGYAGRRALGLAESAQQLVQGGTFAKQLTLQAPYPSVEGPPVVAQLNAVIEGGVIDSGDQESAVVDAVRKGIDEALSGAVGGDRAKARGELTAGAVKLDGLDFAIYLGKQLVTAAGIFDMKHARDPRKLRIVAGQADNVAKAALDLLKESPNKEKEKEVKEFQDQIKKVLKSV